jgi:hypothetical protein
MVIRDVKIFHSKGFQNVRKTGEFGLKINHLATLQEMQRPSCAANCPINGRQEPLHILSKGCSIKRDSKWQKKRFLGMDDTFPRETLL